MRRMAMVSAASASCTSGEIAHRRFANDRWLCDSDAEAMAICRYRANWGRLPDRQPSAIDA